MTASLGELCQRARPELACLGELGRPLLEVLTVVERRAAGRDGSVLADPVFALDVLTAAGPGTDAAVVGRVLDFLRARSGAGPAGPADSPDGHDRGGGRELRAGCAGADGERHPAHLPHLDPPPGRRLR